MIIWSYFVMKRHLLCYNDHEQAGSRTRKMGVFPMNALFSMNIVDIVLGVLLLLSVLGGCMRGVIKSISWLPGLVFGFFAVKFFNEKLMNLIYSNSVLSPMISSLISVVVLMAGTYLVVRLLAHIFASFLEDIGLSAIDKILGGLFALAFTFMLLGFVMMALNHMPFLDELKATLDGSWLMQNIILPFFDSGMDLVKEAF